MVLLLLAGLQQITSIGNYWNHSIVGSAAQISPLSGSVKKQKVKFLGKENITLYGNNYSTLHFKILVFRAAT